MAADLLRMAMPVAVLAAISLIGWVVLASLDRAHRDVLAPGCTALGMLTAVVVLHASTSVVGTEVGAWVLVAAAVATWGFVALRSRERLLVSRATFGRVLCGFALGLVPLVVGLQPAYRVDDASVQHPTDNHDAFWFVSLAAWLEEHPGIERPSVGAGPSTSDESPAYNTARVAVDVGFRLGESLVQSSVAEVSGRPLSSFWYEVTAAWLAAIPGAAIVLAEVLRARWWWGALAGTAASVASFSTFQVYNQNSASVTALACVPFTFAAIRLAAVERGSRRVLAVAAIALAGFVGLYPEMVTVVGVPLVVLVLVGVAAPWRARLRRGTTLVAVAVVLSPLAFFNAYRLQATLSGLAGDWPRRAFTSGWSLAVARAAGTSSLSEPVGTRAITVVVVVVLLAGCAAAAADRRFRWWTVALVASTAAVLAAQFRRDDNYAIERLVMVGQPLLVLAAVLGLCSAADRIGRSARSSADRPSRTPARLAGAAAVALALLVSGVAIGTSVRNLPGPAALRARSVRPDLVAAAGWVRRYAGTDEGVAATVFTDDYVDRLWMADSLRDLEDVSYALLTADYFSRTSFTDGVPTRFVLAPRRVLTNATADAVVAENASYVLVDTAVAAAWFALPIGGFDPFQLDPDGSARTWMGSSATLLVVRSQPHLGVELEVDGADAIGENTVRVVASDGTTSGELAVSATPRAAPIPLPTGSVVTVELVSDLPPAAISSADPRPATMALAGPTGFRL